MIPPADGLTSKQLQHLVQIIEDCQDKGWVHYTYINRNAFMVLCQLGVIGIATVAYHHWQQSERTPFTKDGFVVWVTEKGHQYMRGEISVELPCTLDAPYWSSYGKCKRHKKYHLKDEHEKINGPKVP